MEFFIKKNSTLPVLKMSVTKDGRSSYSEFMNTLELSAIFFSMVNVDTGIPKITSRPAGFVEKILIDEALHFTKGRRIEAAELLGLGRNTLTRKIKELKIEN